MSKSIDIRLARLKFPALCVVCMAPASKHYDLQKTFSQGRRSSTVKIGVPMCQQHFEAAIFKGTTEKLIENLAIVGGIITGLFAAILLFLRWVPTEHDNLFLKLFIGGIVGFGAFIMVWWIIASGLAPLFAKPQSKEARNAVAITYYWRKDEIVRLEFKQAQFAEIVQKTT